jgi:hypothetical protein
MLQGGLEEGLGLGDGVEAGDDSEALFAAEFIHHEMMQRGSSARRAVDADFREIEECCGGGGGHLVYESRRAGKASGWKVRSLLILV